MGLEVDHGNKCKYEAPAVYSVMNNKILILHPGVSCLPPVSHETESIIYLAKGGKRYLPLRYIFTFLDSLDEDGILRDLFSKRKL